MEITKRLSARIINSTNLKNKTNIYPEYRHGFTMTELLTTTAIIGVLAGLLYPVFSSMRENARKTTCLSNMRQVGNAMSLYISDNDDILPQIRSYSNSPSIWTDNDAVGNYVKKPDLFRCPSAPGSSVDGVNYGLNRYIFHDNFFSSPYDPPSSPSSAVIQNPSDTIIVMELGGKGAHRLSHSGPSFFIEWWGGTDVVRDGINNSDYPFDRHLGGCNVLFGDNHVRSLSVRRIKLQQVGL